MSLNLEEKKHIKIDVIYIQPFIIIYVTLFYVSTLHLVILHFNF